MNAILDRLTARELWDLLGVLPLDAARRVLVALLREIAALPMASKKALEDLLLANAAELGVDLQGRRAQAFVTRYWQAELTRQADELLMVCYDVERHVDALQPLIRTVGFEGAAQIARRGEAALAVSAHLGSLAYYIPLFAHFMSRSVGAKCKIAAVMNAPTDWHMERIYQQIERFSKFGGCSITPLPKKPRGEAELLLQIGRALDDGAWVLMQIDAISGGRSAQTVSFAGKQIQLPGAFGAAGLASRRGIPIVPMRTVCGRGGRMILEVARPVVPRGDADTHAEAERIAVALASQLERWVMKNPAEWGMLPKLHHLLVVPPNE